MDRVRVGFIGCGWWATANHLPLLKQRADVCLAAASGLDPSVLKRAQERFGIESVFSDYRELLTLDLDGVVITSPHAFHYEHACAALERDFHIMCEKPMTLRGAEAWALVRRAREKERILLVPYGWNYIPFIQTAREWMQDGLIGEIEHVTCQMASPATGLFKGKGDTPASFRSDIAVPNLETWQVKELGGGYAHGQLTHCLALMFWLTELCAEQVNCRMGFAPSGIDLYDAAIVNFSNGALGAFSGAATLPDDSKFQIDLRIFGTKGILLLDVERERLEVRLHSGQSIVLDVPPGAGGYSCTGPPNTFVDLIQGKGSNNSPGDIGAKTVEVLEAMHLSAQHGKPVAVARESGELPFSGGSLASI